MLGAEPTGTFAGHAGAITAFQDCAWAFYQPHAGWVIWDAEEVTLLVFGASDWAPVATSDAQTEASRLEINATANETNRLAVAAEATLLTHDGAGHQLKINKAGTSDTRTLLFQTG